VSVSRVGDSGVVAYVRGATDVTVSPGQVFVTRDFEAPIGVALTYTVTFWPSSSPSSTQSGSASIMIGEGGCSDTWLTDLARPTNTQKVTVEGLMELDYVTPAGVHWVLDRRTPIVAADVTHTPTFELDFLTATDDERAKARAALGNGTPVLLRTPPENGIGNLYFAATGWKEQRIVRAARVQDRRFSVSCVQVDRPDPALYVPAPPVTYDVVKATYATYADLLAAVGTYDQLEWVYGPGGAAEIVPWPPDDV
jgi:hypothetical protein